MLYVVSKKVFKSEVVYESDFDKLEEYPRRDAFTEQKTVTKGLRYYIFDNKNDILYRVDVDPIATKTKNVKTVNIKNISKLFFSVYVCERYLEFEVASFRGRGKVYRKLYNNIVNDIVECILDFEKKSMTMRR
jgi:hypothetical protein